MTRLVLTGVLASLLGSCGRGKAPGAASSTTGTSNQPSATKSEDHQPPPPPLPVPDSVVVKEAVLYAVGPEADPARNLLDLYLPKEKAGFGTVVFIHGGGYQRGDRSLGHNLGVVMANRGVAVASIGYRLYPQVKPARARCKT